MLTLAPARALGLHDRGMVREGLIADLNVIDPDRVAPDRKSTRLNSSHTDIYPLSLHDALPIYAHAGARPGVGAPRPGDGAGGPDRRPQRHRPGPRRARSEEHTPELQSHRYLPSFPTRRSSDLCSRWRPPGRWGSTTGGWCGRA